MPRTWSMSVHRNHDGGEMISQEWEADPTPIGGTYFIHSPIKTVAAAYDLQTAYAIAAIPEREREIERLRGSNKQLADIVTDQEDRRLKAEARVAELEARLEGFDCCRATIERCAQAIEPNLDIKTESERIKGECAALKWAAATIRALA